MTLNSHALMTKSGQLPAPVGNLDSYIQAVSRLPVLSAEEERSLAVRLRDFNDLDAARQLVIHNLRFVVKVARGYSGYGLPLGDLIQEGNIGLMKAVKRFDPDMKVRLVSFAVHWIRAEMHEFILRNWRIVKVATTKAQRKLFFNLRGAKKRLGWMNREEVETVARDLGVKPEEVMEMEARLSHHDTAFEARSDEDEESSFAPAAFLAADEDTDPANQAEAEDWDRYSRQRLTRALDELDPRSRDILASRWLTEDKATLHELADRYDVSAERIRQIENNAIRKLRSAFTA